MIEELEKRGASVNVTDSNGLTALHWCMNPKSDLPFSRRVAVARILVRLGANWGPNAKNWQPSFAAEITPQFREKVFEEEKGFSLFNYLTTESEDEEEVELLLPNVIKSTILSSIKKKQTLRSDQVDLRAERYKTQENIFRTSNTNIPSPNKEKPKEEKPKEEKAVINTTTEKPVTQYDSKSIIKGKILGTGKTLNIDHL